MTLYIGLYEAPDGSSATTGTLVRATELTELDFGSLAPTPWDALHDALVEAMLLEEHHVVVATNSDKVFYQLSLPADFKPSNEIQWNVLRMLFRYQCRNGTWQIVSTSDAQLQKAKTRWQQQHP